MAIDKYDTGDGRTGRASNINRGWWENGDACSYRCVMRIENQARCDKEKDKTVEGSPASQLHYSITLIPGQPLSSVFVTGCERPLAWSDCCCCGMSPIPWASWSTLWHSAPPSDRTVIIKQNVGSAMDDNNKEKRKLTMSIKRIHSREVLTASVTRERPIVRM